MSLEDKIEKLTATVEKLIEVNLTLLGKDPGSATAPADKPAPKSTKSTKSTKTTTKPTETDDDASGDEGGITFKELGNKALAWVQETGKGSPEQEARSEYLKANIWPKLKVSGIKELEGKPDAMEKFNTWLDTKAKTDLCGYGEGIFLAPADDDDGDEGDDEGL